MAQIKLDIQSVPRKVLRAVGHVVEPKGSIFSTVCKRVMQGQRNSNCKTLKLTALSIMFIFSLIILWVTLKNGEKKSSKSYGVHILKVSTLNINSIKTIRTQIC